MRLFKEIDTDAELDAPLESLIGNTNPDPTFDDDQSGVEEFDERSVSFEDLITNLGEDDFDNFSSTYSSEDETMVPLEQLIDKMLGGPETPQIDGEAPTNDLGIDTDALGQEGMEGQDELGFGAEGEEPKEQNADYQGVIRSVRGANLVYKRQEADDTYSELWVYSIGKDFKKEGQIKKAILAGTDVGPYSKESEDSKQNVDSYTVGNVGFLNITGLTN